MSDKKMMFLTINFLITIISLALIIGTIFIDNSKTKMILTIVAIAILIVQKIVEIIVIKETRKISIIILAIILAAAVYFGYKFY